MKFTSSVEYRIMRVILNHNVNSHFPKIAEILSETNFTTRDTIEATIARAKKKGLIKTLGCRNSYGYLLTESGINRVKSFEDYEDTQLLLTLYKLQSYGD